MLERITFSWWQLPLQILQATATLLTTVFGDCIYKWQVQCNEISFCQMLKCSSILEKFSTLTSLSDKFICRKLISYYVNARYRKICRFGWETTLSLVLIVSGQWRTSHCLVLHCHLSDPDNPYFHFKRATLWVLLFHLMRGCGLKW